MDIHATNKTSNFWEVVYVIMNVRQLFSKHRVSKIVLSVMWMAVQKRKNVVCCDVVLLMSGLLQMKWE